MSEDYWQRLEFLRRLELAEGLAQDAWDAFLAEDRELLGHALPQLVYVLEELVDRLAEELGVPGRVVTAKNAPPPPTFHEHR
jgi:hypothetical protein